MGCAQTAMIDPAFTHRGWFGICPIYLTGLGDGPTIAPRVFIFEPLLWISEAAFALAIFVLSATDPDFEPGFTIRVTGRIHS